ncbi:uncharacterized protein [Periplaneta americana]|uniref:uncharacterized protein n=1 Tax=Periplaneta americana TaxID=6978 RepID=UPI0037E73DF1
MFSHDRRFINREFTSNERSTVTIVELPPEQNEGNVPVAETIYPATIPSHSEGSFEEYPVTSTPYPSVVNEEQRYRREENAAVCKTQNEAEDLDRVQYTEHMEEMEESQSDVPIDLSTRPKATASNSQVAITISAPSATYTSSTYPGDIDQEQNNV